MSAAPYDAVIIGSGINSLVAGAMLAKDGWRVLLCERNDRAGGAICTSTDRVPGFTLELLSSWHPLFVGGPAYGELAGDLGVSPATVLPLSTLEPMDRHAVADILGDGEVSIVAGQDPLYQVQESVLTGVWRVRAESADGHVVSETIEVGDVPRIVRDAAGRYGRPMANVAALALDASVMNAPAILVEIAERAAMWRPGTINHVINFTLLPLTPADTDAITTVLGQVPLTIVSGGYGTCRIMATNVRNVWAVQYLNANGAIILDTVEIGDVPEAARAAQVDFEDSAVRLGEIMEAYLT